MDDGTPLSIGLTAGSGLVVFICVAYVAVDTGFNHSGAFEIDDDSLRNYALYVLYLLFPLLLIVAFFILESVLVLGVLRETRPMGMHPAIPLSLPASTNRHSPPLNLRLPLHPKPNLHLHRQRTLVQRHEQEDRRRTIRDPLRPTRRDSAVVLLE